MYSYNLYNLTVNSCLKFSFLNQSSTVPSVHDITINEINYCPFDEKCDNSDLININTALIHRKGVACFKISSGSKIEFYRENKKVDDQDISRSIVNAIMGYCLYQRKLFVLHASAVKVNSKTIVFIGQSGSGKSSFSASLLSQKNSYFLSEDVACIYFKNNEHKLYPGPPLVKLTDNIAQNLNFDHNDNYSLISDRLNRSLYKVNRSKIQDTRIHKCFFLEWGEKFSINKIKDEHLLPLFLLNTFSAFPYNACKESSVLLTNFLYDFCNNIAIYKLVRNKKNFFKDNSRLIEFINTV